MEDNCWAEFQFKGAVMGTKVESILIKGGSPFVVGGEYVLDVCSTKIRDHILYAVAVNSTMLEDLQQDIF